MALAMHMLYHVSDIPAAVRELRRIVRPGGTALASTNSADSLAEIHQALNEAVSAQLGPAIASSPPLSFTIENGEAALGREFSQVTAHRYDLPLSFPDAAPVLRYINSLREPVMATVGEALDFDAALADVAAQVDQVMRTEGRFRATFRTGVFVCR